jgi:putative SOS response-associated peptidase YedK
VDCKTGKSAGFAPLIPAEGFYEWREEHGKKQPYFFARKDGRPIMFAGIWDYSGDRQVHWV